MGVILVTLWVVLYRVGVFLSVGTLLVAIGLSLVLLSFGVFLSRVNLTIAQRMLRIFVFAVFVAALVNSLWPSERSHGPFSGTGEKRIKHVILIVVDTLRRDALSCYGTGVVPTPNMDALAADWILFSRAISAGPWTIPAMASIFTGLSPFAHLATKTRDSLSDSALTLAEMIQRAGYLTCAVGSNVVLSESRGLSQGFLNYNWYPKPSDDASLGKLLLRVAFPSFYRSQLSTAEITGEAIKWVRANKQNDFFLWIHYFDPHHPYSPPREFMPAYVPPRSMGIEFTRRRDLQSGTLLLSDEERRWVRDLYLGEVRYVDASIGRLLAALKSIGIYDDSLIILTSDHGEEFWEHDRAEHGHTLYDELLAVPLVIRLPRSEFRGRVDTRISTQSVAASVLDLCDIPCDPESIEAQSLCPLWRSRTEDYDPGQIVSSGVMYYEDKEAVYFDNWKYIRSRATGREELYDLETDAHERFSVLNQETETATRARQLLEEHYRTAQRINNAYGIKERTVEYDQETLKRLKALGYM
jgi:arylsulfatase A-like enzyme